MSIDTHILITPTNSREYVEAAFESLNNGFTIEQSKKNSGDPAFVETQSTYGWYKGTSYIPVDAEETAQLLYTSGTTGEPKAVHISHRALKNTTERLVSIMDMTSDVREYIGVPVTYSFGFGRCRAVSLAGGEFYIPQKFDPIEIAEMLKRDEINAISAVPSLWRVLLSVKELFPLVLGEKVKWIEIGSQYMNAQEKLALVELFPNAKIIQHYGLTEASRTTFLKIHEKQALESVGKTYFDNVEIRVNDNGRIAIKGAHLTSKIVSSERSVVFNGGDWFETTDLGKIEDGYLYFLGRDDDVINCGGVKLSPEALEAEIGRELTVAADSFAVFKYTDNLRGEVPALAILSENKSHLDAIKQKLFKLLKEKKLNIESLVKTIEVEQIPKTATNKVKRKQLTRLMENSILEKTVEKERHLTTSNDTDFKVVIENTLKRVLKVKHVSANDSIKSLGGDSLSTLLLMVELEKSGLPNDEIQWLVQGLTLEQVVEKKRLKENRQPSEETSKTSHNAFINKDINVSMYIIRGLFVLVNIFAHWSAGIFERLPAPYDTIDSYLAIFFNSGTTGFALMFGFAFGAQIAVGNQKTTKELGHTALLNIKILFIGMAALSVLKLASWSIDGKELSTLLIANSFYSVLYYYFFAVLIFPYLVHILTKSADFRFAAFIVAMFFWFISLGIRALEIQPSENPLYQLGVLLISSKYNFFGMTAFALLGAMGGYMLRQTHTKNVEVKLYGGAALFITAVYVGMANGELERWVSWPTGALYLSMGFLYLGSIAIFDAVLLKKLDSIGARLPCAFIARTIAAIGLLAFPLFVLHELVLPAVNILRSFDLGVVVYSPFVVFMLIASLMIKRVIKVV